MLTSLWGRLMDALLVRSVQAVVAERISVAVTGLVGAVVSLQTVANFERIISSTSSFVPTLVMDPKFSVGVCKSADASIQTGGLATTIFSLVDDTEADGAEQSPSSGCSYDQEAPFLP